MRRVDLWVCGMLIVLVCAGCASRSNRNAQVRYGSTGAGAGAPGAMRIVTPEDRLTGRVVFLNARSRFVVLSFPIGQSPNVDQRMDVFREGMKVGEIKISGPKREENVVADIVAGEAQIGDEVREP